MSPNRQPVRVFRRRWRHTWRRWYGGFLSQGWASDRAGADDYALRAVVAAGSATCEHVSEPPSC